MVRGPWYPSARCSSTRSWCPAAALHASTEWVIPRMALGPFLDATGESLTLAVPPRRIVSLIPSVTELLFALDAGAAVGCRPVHRLPPARRGGNHHHPGGGEQVQPAVSPVLLVVRR